MGKNILYWDEDGKGGINHATIITKISETELLYAGNTAARFDKEASIGFQHYLNESGSKAALYVIPMKDKVFTNCNSTR